MDSIKIELKVLVESLKKKEHALAQIASISENQGFVLASGATHEEIYSYFMQMNEEKQAFIQTVLQCDQVFENVLQKVGPILDENPSLYKAQVAALQDLIRRVMDLDVQIRVAEQNNSQVLTQRMPAAEAEAARAALLAEKADENGDGKPPAIDSGEYGNRKAIDAYKNQARKPK